MLGNKLTNKQTYKFLEKMNNTVIETFNLLYKVSGEGCGCYWRLRKTEITWADHMKNYEVLQRVKEDRNILHKIK
jgi:hypothetical protein